MTYFLKRQTDLTKQDFRSWHARMEYKWRGLSDLVNRRRTDERRGVLHDLRVVGISVAADF